MLNTTLASLVAKRLANPTASSASWTCARCRSAQNILRGANTTATTNSIIARRYASSTTTGANPSWGKGGQQGSKQRPRNRRILLATTGGVAAATAGLLAVGDDVKNGYEAAERTGRVAAALALNVNDYRTTLNQRDKIEDPEQKEEVLKACHKRCALRTLKVLEKNGGIFIKLGQHLVCPPFLPLTRQLRKKC